MIYAIPKKEVGGGTARISSGLEPTPAAAKDSPLVNAEFLSQLLNVCNKMPRGVVLQSGAVGQQQEGGARLNRISNRTQEERNVQPPVSGCGREEEHRLFPERTPCISTQTHSHTRAQTHSQTHARKHARKHCSGFARRFELVSNLEASMWL